MSDDQRQNRTFIEVEMRRTTRSQAVEGRVFRVRGRLRLRGCLRGNVSTVLRALVTYVITRAADRATRLDGRLVDLPRALLARYHACRGLSGRALRQCFCRSLDPTDRSSASFEKEQTCRRGRHVCSSEVPDALPTANSLPDGKARRQTARVDDRILCYGGCDGTAFWPCERAPGLDAR